MSSVQARHWVFTVNNPQGDIYPEEWSDCRYACWVLEMGESGTPHFQGYVEFSKPKRRSAVSRCLPHAYLAPRERSREAARAYAMKKSPGFMDGPWEFGSFEAGGAGRRNDLKVVQAALDAGTSMEQIARDHFSQWVKYGNAFARYQTMVAPPRMSEVTVEVIIGPTGTGKTRSAMDRYPNAFIKEADKWWDGYTGQDVVVWDEFKGCYPWTRLLRCIDRYPYQAEVKGGYVAMRATTFIFTSNSLPYDWYDGTKFHLDALYRRVSKWVWMPQLGVEHAFNCFADFQAAFNLGEAFLPPTQILYEHESLSQ